MGSAAISGAISGFGYGVTFLYPPSGILRKVAVNSAIAALSGVVGVASDPNSKMSGVEGAVLGGVLGNIGIPKIKLKPLRNLGKTFVSTCLFLDILLNHIK